METIVELLKTSGENVCLISGDTRLFWDDDLKAWVVWQRRKHKHYADTGVFETEFAAVARFCLLAMTEPLLASEAQPAIGPAPALDK